MVLYTIGFTQKSDQEFFELLAGHRVQLLVDIRLNPGCQLAGFAKQGDLPYFLPHLAAGCRYRHLPELAPTKQILYEYRTDGDWAHVARPSVEGKMKTRLVITDLTRMQEQRVCVAGYDGAGRCICPVLPSPGVQECSLYAAGAAIIFPFAEVEYELIEPTPDPPHTEDFLFDPGRVRGCGVLPTKERMAFLLRTLSPSVADIFGAPVYKDVGHFVCAGGGTHSLGTVHVRPPIVVSFQAERLRSLKPRLTFCDASGAEYALAVVDLAWRYRAERLHFDKRVELDALAHHFGQRLRGDVFLRIGLARGWSKHPDRCYLQVTGVHTFPDYLEGRTFADFAPQAEDDDW